MNIKKVIPLIVITITMFLIGNLNVLATGGADIDSYFNSYYKGQFSDTQPSFVANNIGDTYTFPVYNKDFNEEMIIHYERDGIYWKTKIGDELVYSESDYLTAFWSLVYDDYYKTFQIFLHKNSSSSNYHYLNETDSSSYDNFPIQAKDLGTNTRSDLYKIVYNGNRIYTQNTSNTNFNFANYYNAYFYGSNKAVYLKQQNKWLKSYPYKTSYCLGYTNSSNYTYENFSSFVSEWTNTEFMSNAVASETYRYYYTGMVDYIKNEEYTKYGKYHIASASSTINGRYAFITDYPEQIRITSYDGNFTFTAYYDEDKPVYLYRPYNNQSKYITSNTSFTNVGYFKSNYSLFIKNDGSFPSGTGNFWSNIPEIKIADNIEFTLYDYTYEPGSTLFYGSNNGTLYTEPSETILNYKTSITSNDESGRKSKVSVEFNENDSTINKFNYAQFKLQYGSTDFSNENIPVFSHFRIYGKLSNSDASAWQELNLSDFIIDDEKMSLEIIDTNYDYVPGSLADSTMTFQLNFFETISSLYETWKIEFYFDNCDSSYFYLFDSLDNSKWLGYSDMFKDYMFYEFPSNYNYAFISSSDEISVGRVYFPTHKINEDYVRLNGKYYNIKTKKFDEPLVSKELKEDDYYSYIDFEFDSSKYLFALNRYQGNHSELYFKKNSNKSLLTFTYNMLNSIFYTFGDLEQDKQNIDKYSDSFSKVNIIPSETAYFYVPIGYNVVFSNDASSVSINTNQGYIDIDVSDTIDDNNASDYYTSESKILQFIRKWWNNMIAPFKVFGQLKGIIENIHFDSNNNSVPKFEIDFSFFGVSQKQNIINFTWYLQYRDIIFNFIYLVIGSITITKVIHNLKRAFGGGN